MPQRSAKEILKRYWGHEAFRPLQEEVIDSVMQGNDTLVLMPTGGGKSLCYQIPAMAMEGICLVVSPLISLMKDQVQQLNDRGIKATCLISGTTGIEQEIIFNNCIHGNVKLLYVSPERLRQRVFIEHFRQMKVSMIAVDEAHCISQWGYDFRPSYLEIARIRVYFPLVPIVALTATATPEVVEDIQRQLMFRPQRHVFQTSFCRKNLAYMVFHEMDKQIVKKALFRDPNFGRDDLMHLTGVDKNALAAIIQKYAGTNVPGYINSKRMEYAIVLIKIHPEYTLNAIAEACGIKASATFIRHFKKTYGMTPSEYRAQIGASDFASPA
jgi:superfamily II DNA helicase RecQ